jgi:hypothetical protein
VASHRHRALFVVLLACGKTTTPASDPVIEDFRRTEHSTLVAFNDLLHQQKANAIDEHTLAEAITKEVLPAWHALHARVDAATPPDSERELYVLMRRYLAERETGWQAYVAALSADSDELAHPHYATYHAQTDAATDDAKLIGAEFRRLELPPLPK